MIKLKDVLDFIEKEKEVFEKFTQEIANATKVNKSTLENGVERIYIKRAYRNKSKVLFKENNYRATPKEIFFDLLLNGYNTIKSGKEFNLTKADYENKFYQLTLNSTQEKLAYLASLYMLMFDYEYTKTFYDEKFEEFMLENELLIFKLGQENWENFEQIEILVTSRGRKGGARDNIKRINNIKNNYYITGYQIGDEYTELRDKIDSKEEYTWHRELYELVKDKVPFKRIFPTTLAEKIEGVINRPPVAKMLTNMSNEFAIKALKRSLPDEFDEVVYKNYKYGILNDKENDKVDRDELKFIAAKVLVDKYGYNNITKSGFVGWADPGVLINIDPLNNKQYKKMYEADSELIRSYIKKYHSTYYISKQDYMMNFLFMFVVMYKQKEDTLKKLVKDTKNDFEKMVKNITTDTEKIMKNYTVKNIKNKRLFKQLLPHLNELYFYKNSEHYVSYPKKVQELLCANYLNTMVLEKTVHIKTHKIIDINQEVKKCNYGEDILNQLAEIFNFERK